MAQDYSNQDLKNAVLQNKDLNNSNFSGSDLRGADFTGSDLSGADLSKVRTGITPVNVILLFILSLAVSLLSGYVAAKAGLALKGMVTSDDHNIELAGIAGVVIISFILIYICWKGGPKTISRVVIPVIIALVLLAVILNVTGLGTGKGTIYILLAVIVVVIMILIGTVSRAAAGSLSNIFFAIVAIAGGAFGKNISGGIGPVILAVVCMIVSKRALAGNNDFGMLKNLVFFITKKYGTSFRNANLIKADFSGSKLHNADFTGADLTSVNWADAKKFNCKLDDTIITDKKKKKHG